MNGQEQDKNTTFSIRKSSNLKAFGLNSSRSIFMTTFITLLRITYGFVTAAGDTGLKLASWQYVHGGTWSPQDFADYNSFKHLIAAIFAITPFAYSGVPFEMARRAYYADKSWPLELRKGYSSPLNALIRIPFEEGPYYLFKGGFPIAASHWLFWVTYLTIYSFEKNKFFFLWVYNDFNYSYIKAGMMGIAFALASWASYPAYFVREMVDIWPKERGGHCTWNNNYRQCMKWMMENMDMHYYNYMSGYTRWLTRYGIGYFIGLWVADNLGMFSNCNEAWASLE
jgi:hypothetical protein